MEINELFQHVKQIKAATCHRSQCTQVTYPPQYCQILRSHDWPQREKSLHCDGILFGWWFGILSKRSQVQERIHSIGCDLEVCLPNNIGTRRMPQEKNIASRY